MLVPPKVKNLLWRMWRGCLPTRVRLQDKGVSCPTNCGTCGADHEDLNHLLFECSFSIQVWNSAGIWFEVQNAAIRSDSAINAIFYLLHALLLFKHRNLKIWENVDENSAQVVDRARHLIEEWQEANIPTTSQQVNAQQQQPVTPLQFHAQQHQNRPAGSVHPKWTPPSIGRFKCNVDAAFSEQFHRTGIGVYSWWFGNFCAS